MLARAGQANRLDEPLLAKVPKVTRAEISRAMVVVPQITTGDHPEHTNGRQGAGFGAAQGVVAVPIAHDLALQAAREVNVADECVTWVHLPIALVAVAFQSACVITTIAHVLV